MRRSNIAMLPALALMPFIASCDGGDTPPVIRETMSMMEGSPEDIAAEVEKAKKELREELGNGFVYDVVDERFITACNGGERVAEAAKGTIRRVCRAMAKDFFTTKIDFPIKVCLFKDKESYEAFNVKKFGSKPSTPYGFYRSSARMMVMNIATGTGTLAHEMIHPLLAHDFPDVPSWFNEGFASLYERSSFDSDGSIKGMVNWRLPGLRKAIDDANSVPLKDLMATTTDQFYGERSGLHYAEARYLCLHLQEKGLLKQFYKEFKGRYAEEKEKAGVAALEKVCGKKLDAFEPEWIAWVKTLKQE